MVTGGSEERVQFHNTNGELARCPLLPGVVAPLPECLSPPLAPPLAGLIKDPMAVYRAAKLANVWTDEEKKIFREK